MIDALITIGYGVLTLGALILALASRRFVVIGAAIVFWFDFGAANYVLALQGFPNALWAWPVINIVCALAICGLRTINPRKSLELIAWLYVLRCGIDIQHALVGGVFPYTLETNLVFILQLVIVAREGADGLGRLIGRWGGDQRHRVLHPAGASRQTTS